MSNIFRDNLKDITIDQAKDHPSYFTEHQNYHQNHYDHSKDQEIIIRSTYKHTDPHFLAYMIVVHTYPPLKQVVSKPDLAGQVIMLSIEISKFDISFEAKKTLKD